MEPVVVTGAHREVFKNGFYGKKGGLKARVINEGCTGCHNLLKGNHGAITNCTDCHDFSFITGIHVLHTQRIEETAELNGVEPENSCEFCHYQGNERYKAGCYNCHLSGHAPSLYYWRIE